MSRIDNIEEIEALATLPERGDDNDRRVQRAAVAIAAYVEKYGRDIPQTAISDLLADLMHLADVVSDENGDPLSFDDALDTARMNYEEERDE